MCGIIFHILPPISLLQETSTSISDSEEQSTGENAAEPSSEAISSFALIAVFAVIFVLLGAVLLFIFVKKRNR